MFSLNSDFYAPHGCKRHRGQSKKLTCLFITITHDCQSKQTRLSVESSITQQRLLLLKSIINKHK